MTARTVDRAKMRKIILQFVIGAVSGALISYFGFAAMKGHGVDIDSPTRVLAFGEGLVFAAMGLFVALGVLAPNAGSHLLNVEDADELREQQQPLKYGALVFVLTGIAMLVLSLSEGAGSGGLIAPGVAAAIAAACFLGVAWFSYVSRKVTDELMLSIGREASTATLYVLIVIAIGWTIVAQFRPVTPAPPLALLSALLAIYLVTMMVVAGRRGLLTPR